MLYRPAAWYPNPNQMYCILAGPLAPPSHTRVKSLFENRLPIGLMEIIKNVTPETVRSFYKRHYHPERMAVVAVGDFPDGGQGVVRGKARVLLRETISLSWRDRRPEASLLTRSRSTVRRRALQQRTLRPQQKACLFWSSLKPAMFTTLLAGRGAPRRETPEHS